MKNITKVFVATGALLTASLFFSAEKVYADTSIDYSKTTVSGATKYGSTQYTKSDNFSVTFEFNSDESPTECRFDIRKSTTSVNIASYTANPTPIGTGKYKCQSPVNTANISDTTVIYTVRAFVLNGEIALVEGTVANIGIDNKAPSAIASANIVATGTNASGQTSSWSIYLKSAYSDPAVAIPAPKHCIYYYRKDNGSWKSIGEDLSCEQATFEYESMGTGKYDFYAVAKDGLGNTESQSPSVETTITITSEYVLVEETTSEVIPNTGDTGSSTSGIVGSPESPESPDVEIDSKNKEETDNSLEVDRKEKATKNTNGQVKIQKHDQDRGISGTLLAVAAVTIATGLLLTGGVVFIALHEPTRLKLTGMLKKGGKPVGK